MPFILIEQKIKIQYGQRPSIRQTTYEHDNLRFKVYITLEYFKNVDIIEYHYIDKAYVRKNNDHEVK